MRTTFSEPQEGGPERILDMSKPAVERFAEALDDALSHPSNGIARVRQTVALAPNSLGLASLDLVTTAAREYLVILRLNAESPASH